MGTVRNRVVIVHGSENQLKILRKSAVDTFQPLVDRYCWKGFNVSKDMISPIFAGLCNSVYTFFINGECSKLGWNESDEFVKIRDQWCNDHKDDCFNMIIVDFGDDYGAKLKEYMRHDES